jgi:uncharacterized membrane protein
MTGPAGSARHRRDGDGWTGIALVAALVAMALVAGLNFTFAVAVMPNLAGADDHTFVATTQRFNENPVFPLAFTVALVLTAAAAVLQRRRGPALAMGWTVAALALYGVVLTVTSVLHVPLDEDIDAAGEPDRIADLALVRERFAGPWVAGNVVRTVACTAVVAALGRALVLLGSGTAGGPARPR